MREYHFKWERKREADQRRSYNSHRKRFLAGDLEKGWKPSNPAFCEFPSFEEYQKDLQSRTEKLLEGEVTDIDPKLADVRILFYGTGDYSTIAKYFNTSRDGQTVRMGLSLDNTVNALIGGEDISVAELQHTIAHELRHHVDRATIQRMRNILGKKFDLAKKEKLEYLFGVRTEGLAEFDPRHTFYKISDNPAIRGESFNKEVLRKQTKNVDDVLEFLDAGSPKPVIEGDITYPGDVWNWQLKLFDIKKKKGFSQYRQGPYMFAVIKEAERLRAQASVTEFRDAETFRGIVNKIVALPSFGEFYRFYYECANDIGLSENEMVIRPKHSEVLIKEEQAWKESSESSEKLFKAIFGDKLK